MPFENPIARFSVSLILGTIASLTACSSKSDAPAGDTPGVAPPASTQEAAQLDAAAQQSATRLESAYPKATVQLRGNRIRRLYGVAATGTTPDAAAESFRVSSAAAFGVDRNDLVPAASGTKSIGLMYDRATGKHKFRLYLYDQQHDGTPVFRAGLRTLVREGGDNAVVWANVDLRSMGTLKARTGLQARSLYTSAGTVNVEKSLKALQTGAAGGALPAPSALTKVSAAKPTIFAGTDQQAATPQRAIEYTAEAADGRGKWTFVADAATGDVLHVESNLHFDVSGTVSAQVTAGSGAKECGGLVVAPLAYANVSSAEGSAVTDATGAFTLRQAQSGPATVVSNVSGTYITIDDAGSSDSISLSVTPPEPAHFLHRDAQNPQELVLAQLNAYTAASDARAALLAAVPEYPLISGQTGFRIIVNQTGDLCGRTGGAWYDDDSFPHTLNFCQQTEERANTAFRSIVHHEYGHHIVESGGSGQGEYGEGMSDTVSVLLAKDPRVGVGYHRNRCETSLRNVVNDCQYSEESCSSCGGGLYECSGLLSGTIWDLWQRLDATEPQRADTIIRELVLSSVPLHTGSRIDESIALDLLTLDDDDALLENGTPHYDEICGAFAKHGMKCPPMVGDLVVKGGELVSEGPSEGPFAPASISFDLHNLGPQQNLAYTVKVATDVSWLSVSSTGGSIALGQKVAVTLTINQAAAAALPDGNYSATIQFLNESTGVSTSRDVRLRVGAPSPVFTADFDSGLDGFIVDNEPGNLWHQSSACVDALPGHSSPGSLYYGKDDACHYAASTPILHTVTSPAVDVVNPSTAELGFKYFLETENSSDYDRASVLISVNGGEFQTIASNNSTGQKLKETNAWQELRFDIGSLLPPSATARIQLQFAFNGVTIYDNSKRGFAVDDVIVYAKPLAAAGDR